MAAKTVGRGRRRTPASTPQPVVDGKALQDQENVIDSTTDPGLNGGAEGPKAKGKAKGKKEEKVVDEITEDNAGPSKSKRGRKAAADDEGPAPKAAKGRPKKGKEVESTVNGNGAAAVDGNGKIDEPEETTEQAPVPKKRGGKKAAEPKLEPESVESKPGRGGGGRKAAAAAKLSMQKEIESDRLVDEKQKQDDAKQKETNKATKSKKAVAEKAVEEEEKDGEEDEEVLSAKKPRGKSGPAKKAKTKVVDEKNVEEKVEKETAKRGRKRKELTDAEITEEVDRESPIPQKKSKVTKKGKSTPIEEEKEEVKLDKKEDEGEDKKEVKAPAKGRKRPAKKATTEPKEVQPIVEPEEDEAEEKEVIKPPAPTKGRKRTVKKTSSEPKEEDPVPEPEDEDEAKEVAETKKSATKAAPKAKLNPSKTSYAAQDFGLDKEYKLKISSWNVAGLRSWIQKGGLEFLEYEKPDILCLQETKCTEDQLPDEARIAGYHPYWLCKPGGHAGIAIYSKIMPINVEYGIGDAEQDESGRIMTAEYEKFFLICVYVPNAGRKLVTLPKRLRWNKIFEEYVTRLNAKKPVIICGDMNVAHEEIDLANPKTNRKNAGFTQEERDGMTHLLELGFVDTFRHLYPGKEKAYTFWSYMGNARAKNVGWRLDYFIVSQKIVTKVVDNVMRSQVLGSDHCPITLFADL